MRTDRMHAAAGLGTRWSKTGVHGRFVRHSRAAAFAASWWLLSVLPASGQAPTVYTNRAAWAAAAGGATTTVTFDGIAAAGGFAPFDTASGLTVSGVSFVGSSPSNARSPYYLRVVHPQFFPAYYDWGSGAVLHGSPEYVAPSGVGGANSHIMATLPANVTAAGTDIMSFLQYGTTFRIIVTTTAGSFTFTLPSASYPARAFAGFVSSTPILSIRFFGTAGFPVLDNFTLGAGGGNGGGGNVGGAPTNLMALVSGSAVDFSWTAPAGSPSPSGYVVEAALAPGGTVIASLNTSQTSIRVTGVPTGLYFVHVRAAYAGGLSSPSGVVQVLVSGGPPSAMVLTVTRPSVRIGEHVTFSWTDQVLGPGAQYTLFVAGPGSSTFTPLTFAPCCIFEVDIPPAPIGTYRLYVRAPNGVQSNTVTLDIVP